MIQIRNSRDVETFFCVCSDGNKVFLHISRNLLGAGKTQVSKSSCSAGNSSTNSWSREPGVLSTWRSVSRYYSYLLFSRMKLKNGKGNIQGFLLTHCTLLLHTRLLHLFITEVSKRDPDPSASGSWVHNMGNSIAVS